MSKYNKLWEFIKDDNSDLIKLTFNDIRKILWFDIDHSFLTFKKKLIDFGYKTGKISLKEKYIVFHKL